MYLPHEMELLAFHVVVVASTLSVIAAGLLKCDSTGTMVLGVRWVQQGWWGILKVLPSCLGVLPWICTVLKRDLKFLFQEPQDEMIIQGHDGYPETFLVEMPLPPYPRLFQPSF